MIELKYSVMDAVRVLRALREAQHTREQQNAPTSTIVYKALADLLEAKLPTHNLIEQAEREQAESFARYVIDGPPKE